MKKFYLFLILLNLAGMASVQAQLLQWNTFGNTGLETTEPSAFNDPNISPSNLTQGAGIAPAANANRFGGTNWFDVTNPGPTNTLAEAIAGNNYIEFIVTPNGGFSFTPTSFVFVWDRSAGGGPSSVALRSSADGFTADLGTVTGIVSGAFATNTITISGLTALTAVTTFRLYGYGASLIAGTGGFDVTVNTVNVQLNGTTAVSGPNVLVNPGAGAYNTLQDAFAAINAGTHTGAVTVDIIGSTTEPGTAVLNASGVGAASYTSITMQPSGGAARTISGNLALPLIDLNGADNVTIDGLNTGGNKLTLSNTNTSTTAGTSTIRFKDGATNNLLTNCDLKGSMTMPLATDGGIVYFATDVVTANGNDGNTVSNCNIGPAGINLPTKCVYGNGSTGTAAIRNSGILINNNNIFDFFLSTTSVSGVHVLSGNDGWTISNNRIYQTTARTFTVLFQRYAGITLNTTTGTAGAFTVSGNRIGFANAAGTGITSLSNFSNEFRGIDAVKVNTSTATSIQGNIISGITQLSGRASNTFTSSVFIAIMLGTNGGSFNCGNITGNTIGSLDGSSSIIISATATIASCAPMMCIYDLSSNGNNISNNNMGSITLNDGGSGTATGFRGILVQSISTGITTTINNNTVGGTVANSITDNIIGVFSGGYSITGIETYLAGIYASGNIVRNITGKSSTGLSVIGILVYSSTAANYIGQNTVHTLTNTSTILNGVAMMGIAFEGSINSNIVERNYVHTIYNTSNNPGCAIYGILAFNGTGSTATYSNNMISLGFQADGSSITKGCQFYGLGEAINNNTNNFYHNSVFVGGTGVVASTSKSYAFISNVTGNTRNYQNNIFYNARSNAVVTGTPQHFAINVGGNTQYPTGLTSNYNVLFATGNDAALGFFNGVSYLTLPAWRTATGQDMISINADPKFINPAGTALTTDLHLQPATYTVCEGNGRTGLPVTLDIDGQTRSSLSPVDIGADAGDFYDPLLTDLVGPEISYTLLASSSCTTPGPTLSAVITDISGVNITAGTRPRLYYKKTTNANAYTGNTNATDGWKYVEATGAGNSPFSFIIDYSLINGGVAVGNTIQYFITAQDLVTIPNVSINSGIYAPAFMPASVALTVTAFPVHDPVNTYTVSAPGVGANVSIGAAGTYPSLTGPGGLFDMINTAGLAANITATIIDAAVTETGAIALNQMSYGCGGPYTLTIVPAAPGTIVTGSLNSDALIKIKSSNVIIDGSSNATSSRDLTIINTSVTAPAVVLIGSTGTAPVTNTTIKNCVLINGLVTGGTALAVSDGTVLGSPGYFNNISIQNNDIQKTFTGIDAVATAVAGNGSGLNIASNTMNAGLLNAIGNTGIKITGVDGATVSGNDIGNFESITNEVDAGIWLTTGTTNTLVEKNNIHDIQYNGISGYGGKGIYINTGLAAANIAVQNNMIYGITGDGNDYTTNGALYCPVGIYASGTGQGGINMYYNSIYLSGATLNFTADVYSIGIALDDNTAATIKNNIVKNQLGLLGGIGFGAVGIAAQTSAGQFTSLDYNDYFSQVVLGSNVTGKIGIFNYLSLGAWQTATTQEASSLNWDPVFVSATDLHLSTANCDLDGYGTPVAGITTDIDANTRDVAAPDMGADEFTASHPLALAGVTGSAICDNKTVSPLGTTYTNNVCPIIATVSPSGGAAVNGKINVCVTLDAAQQYFNAEPYVQRHIDIEPELAPATATATITLYFTDQEFVDYNTNNPVWPKLPTAVLGNADPNIANLRITQYHGTPTGGLPTPTPGNYTGTGLLINPADVNITWNGSYWSVTFDVTGFSGFYAHSTIYNAPLPITLNYLNGHKQGSNHLLNWKVTCNSTPRVTMVLERSADSRNFSSINSITADAVRCNQPFNYIDTDPLKGMNYYRLKMTDADGKISYSSIVALLNAVKGFNIISIAPNPVITNNFKLNIASAQAGKMDIAIFDMQGRLVNRQSIAVIAGFNSLPVQVNDLSAGTYTIRGNMADEQSKVIRFVKQ